MNTIEIRKNHKELIDNLNESIKRYRIWEGEGKSDWSPFLSYESKYYDIFLKECVVEDLNSLAKAIKEGKIQ
jgi:hypothetical protein